MVIESIGYTMFKFDFIPKDSHGDERGVASVSNNLSERVTSLRPSVEIMVQRDNMKYNVRLVYNVYLSNVPIGCWPSDPSVLATCLVLLVQDVVELFEISDTVSIVRVRFPTY